MTNSSWFVLTIPFMALLMAVAVHVSGGLVDFYHEGSHVAQRGGTNLVSGNGISISSADDAPNSRVGFTLSTKADSGTATVAASATSIAVTHALGATPARVLISPTTDTLGARFWVSAKTTSNFTITINTSQASDIDFDWRVQAEE